jgi:hypothetical protein
MDMSGKVHTLAMLSPHKEQPALIGLDTVKRKSPTFGGDQMLVIHLIA